QVLTRLVDTGNTIVVIEHNLDVIKTADYLIDLGPEGGDAGGYLVAVGTREELTELPESYTGQFLRPLLHHGRTTSADRANGHGSASTHENGQRTLATKQARAKREAVPAS